MSTLNKKADLLDQHTWDWNSSMFFSSLKEYDLAPESRDPETFSKYTASPTVSTKVGPMARANSGVMRAAERLYLIDRGVIEGGVGMTDTGYPVIQVPAYTGKELREAVEGKSVEKEGFQQVLFIPKTGVFWAREVLPDGTSQPLAYFSKEKGHSTPFLMAVLMAAQKDNELRETLESIYAGFDTGEDVSRLAMVAGDNIYRRNSYGAELSENGEVESVIVASPVAKDIRKLDGAFLKRQRFVAVTGKIDGVTNPSPATSEEGKTKEEKPKEKPKKKESEEKPKAKPEPKIPSNIEELRGFYAFNPLRVYSEEEKKLMPFLPNTHQVTEDTITLCSLIKDSTHDPIPIRHFLFVGEGGSGKSVTAKEIAIGNGQPMVFASLHSDADTGEITKQPMPTENGGWLWQDGPIIQAAKNGWVCEVSEADTLLKPGELSFLNPLFDSTQQIQLTTGEVIHLHPDAVFIFTINANYEGCRDMNQAFKDRLIPWGFEKPGDEILMERVINESGLNDRHTVRRMLDVLHHAESHCEDAFITDGIVGVRSLIDWARLVKNGMDPYNAARKSICYKWTLDRKEHEQLLKCVEAQFRKGGKT